MASTTGFIEKWSNFCLGRNNRRKEDSVAAVAGAAAGPSEVHPPRSIALRAEVAHRWMSVAAGPGASAGAVAAGASAGVGGAGIGAAGTYVAAGVASGASGGVGTGTAAFAACGGAAAAGAATAGVDGGGGGVVAGAADVGPAAAGMGAAAVTAAGVGSGASAATTGVDVARTYTPVPHAAEALQTKPPAATPLPTKPGVAGSANNTSKTALEEKVDAGSAGHGEGVRGAVVGESADESSLVGASVLHMLEQAREALGGGQGEWRLPVEHVREVVAMWEEEEEGGVRRSTVWGVTGVETVKALFSGWVEAGALSVFFIEKLERIVDAENILLFIETVEMKRSD